MRMLSPGETRGAVGKLEFPLPDAQEAFMTAVRAPEYRALLRSIYDEMLQIHRAARDGPSGQTAEELADYIYAKIKKVMYPND